MWTNGYSNQIFNSSEKGEKVATEAHEEMFLILIIIFGFSALLGLLGIIGNIGLIVVYRKKPLNVRFNALMLTLATFDLIFILTVPVIAVLAMQAIFMDLFGPLHVFYYFNQVAFSGSILTTIAVAAERYLMVCKGKDTDKHAFKWTVATIVTSSLLISLPSPSFAHDLGLESGNTNAQVYLIVTVCLKSVLLGLVSSGLIMFMNISTYKKLKECKIHLQSESSLGFSSGASESLLKTIFQTKLSLIISSVFVISQAFSWIPLIAWVSSPSLEKLKH